MDLGNELLFNHVKVTQGILCESSTLKIINFKGVQSIGTREKINSQRSNARLTLLELGPCLKPVRLSLER